MKTKFISLEIEGGGILLTKPHKIDSIFSGNGWVEIAVGNHNYRYKGSLKHLEEKIETYESAD